MASASSSNLDTDVGTLAQSLDKIVGAPSPAPGLIFSPKVPAPELMYPKPSRSSYHRPAEYRGYKPLSSITKLLSDEERAKFTPTLCRHCETVHNPYAMCHNKSCGICYSKYHLDLQCHCLRDIRKGVKFNSSRYELTCHCGFPFFDEEKWACTIEHCNSTYARLQRKECEICRTRNRDHHTTFECPEDKALAASFKSQFRAMADSGALSLISPIEY